MHPRSITNTLHLSATINHEHRPRAFLPPWQNTTVPVILTGTIYNVSSHLQCAISIVTYRCQRERPRNVPQRETFWLRPPFLTGMELPATNSSMVPFSLQMWPPALSSMQYLYSTFSASSCMHCRLVFRATLEGGTHPEQGPWRALAKELGALGPVLGPTKGRGAQNGSQSPQLFRAPL